MISVIVSVYNKQEVVADCVSSILNQSYQDFELVVVDDGSTDESATRVARFSTDSRVRMIRTKRGGPARAKNEGAKEARGNIFHFVDGDCILLANSLERLKTTFDESAVGCVGGGINALNRTKLIPRAIEIIHNDLIKDKWPVGPNVAYSREAFERAGGFDELMRSGADVELFLKTRKLGFSHLIDPEVRVSTIYPSGVFDLFGQRVRWGKGYAQLVERHPDVSVREIHRSLFLISLTLASCALTIIDLRLLVVFFVLGFLNVFRFLPASAEIARRTGKNQYTYAITMVKFLNAIAYCAGYYYWRLLEHAGKREILRPWSLRQD
jgi:glycosyltransferase involved in cell wall biosynthesis